MTAAPTRKRPADGRDAAEVFDAELLEAYRDEDEGFPIDALAFGWFEECEPWLGRRLVHAAIDRAVRRERAAEAYAGKGRAA